jgi:hypothetical protein
LLQLMCLQEYSRTSRAVNSKKTYGSMRGGKSGTVGTAERFL